MPELPDVEVFRRYFDATSLNQTIDRVEVKAERMLEDTSSQKIRQDPVGKSFESTMRYGKNLFAKLDDNLWLLLHFGMSGFLKYYKNPEEAPNHPRVIFHFSNGYNLAYDNMRMFGKVRLLNDVGTYLQKQNLGPDALSLEQEEFEEMLSQKRGMIKSALMDQSFIAGLGNIYVDELLFQAGVHPKSQTSALDEETVETIFNKMSMVLQTAINHNVNVQQLPENYLIHRRTPDIDCPVCGGKIRKDKISARSTYYCENHQQKY